MPNLAARAADTIHRGFDDYHELFRSLTRKAKRRFEQRDWDGMRRDAVRRIELHPRSVDQTILLLDEDLGAERGDPVIWARMKDEYTRSILGRDDFEIALTYYNSISRRVFSHVGVNAEIDFVAADVPLPYRGWEMSSARMYATRRIDRGVLERVLEDADLRAPFERLEHDLDSAVERIDRALAARFHSSEIEALDVLRPVFVRNKGAYVVGRARRGTEVVPVILVLVHGERGLRIDSALVEESDASLVFSFAHWYFHADLASPRQAIGFLSAIMPRKRISELYLSLGYDKHAKTEFFRDLLRQIHTTDEQFEIAPGVPGLVMSVFTLPSFEFVFKVIKDEFPPQKKVTRRIVLERYRDVQRHDRVGRLVDFQQFEHLEFPRSLFSPELLDELSRVASRSVRVDEQTVALQHLYVGRRVVPLNLFVRQAPLEDARAAVLDWGRALKDLAAANVFAGDMLPKNFGVTRHGRVVFYDYDEICPLLDCRFRKLPPPRDIYDEMAARPIYAIDDRDVFPEELKTFLGLPDPLREHFLEHHGDLFDLPFWQGMQERNRSGELVDVFPYEESKRLGS